MPGKISLKSLKRCGCKRQLPFATLKSHHKQIKRIQLVIQWLKRKEESQITFINSALRKARTRTLVQAGGLLEKAGLLDEFSIELGTDLQKDVECKDQVLALFGTLLELKSLLKETDEYSHTYLEIKGKSGLKNKIPN